ncbi:MAG: hypothetical protein K6F78_04910 [Bacteroidaceae bacterium]|nr:hypothetical protein [Bacteroidaceae bacterium]
MTDVLVVISPSEQQIAGAVRMVSPFRGDSTQAGVKRSGTPVKQQNK